MSCAATNVGALQNALALNTTLFSDLATVRNFYAHRNADTWRKVRRKGQDLGVFGAAHANDLVTSTLTGKRKDRVMEGTYKSTAGDQQVSAGTWKLTAK